VDAVPWRWPGDGWPTLRDAVSRIPRAIAAGDNPAFGAAVARRMAERRPDVVLAFELGAAPFVPHDTGVRAVLDGAEFSAAYRERDGAHGAARLRRTLTQAKSDAYWRAELRRFARVTAVSDAEAEAVRTVLGPGGPSVAIVPNGVDTVAFDPAARRPVPGRLLYAGSVCYGPNRDAVRWFALDVLPRVVASVPDAHLRVTGAAPAAAVAEFTGDPRVTFTGPLSDVRPELAAASVAVVPLVTGGGGTRLKLLEAWAAGVPVVSTPLGAAGLDAAEDGRDLLLAETPEAFAAAVVRLLRDPDFAFRLAGNGRRIAVERYDWSRSVVALSEVLNGAAARP
jgi:glycosyltransferase involved in cell wall biosynthesis